MRFTLIVLLMMFCTPFAKAEWVRLATTPNDVGYFDPATISKLPDGSVKVHQLTDYDNWRYLNSGVGYRSSVSVAEYNCASREVQTMPILAFPNPVGTGTKFVLNSGDILNGDMKPQARVGKRDSQSGVDTKQIGAKSAWIAVTNGTGFSKILDVVCSHTYDEAAAQNATAYRQELSALGTQPTALALEKFIEKYRFLDLDGAIVRLDKQLREMKQLAKYRDSFKGSVTASDWEKFIATYSKYSKFDPDNLVPVAEQRLKTAQAEEERKQSARAAEERKEAAAWEAQEKKNAAAREVQQKKEASLRQSKLESWRKAIKVGDDTFCGPVIEVRMPMIKIAVSAPLPGYPGESWLKASDIYPGWMAACRNSNGHLTAVFN